MISIEIPTIDDKYLRKVLESIRVQTSQNYEVLVIDSSRDYVASDVASEYGAKVIKEKCGLLKARYILHLNSRGERALLLDSTRTLKNNAIEILERSKNDMEIIAEREVGPGILRGAVDTDRVISFRSAKHRMTEAYVLPRYFKSNVLTNAFEALKRRLGPDFEKITGEDHKLIFIESKKISSSIGMIDEPLIFHYGDNTVSGIFKKAMRYSRSAKIASKYYPEVNVKMMRELDGLKLRELIPLFVLYAVQLSGSALGRIIGSGDPY